MNSPAAAGPLVMNECFVPEFIPQEVAAECIGYKRLLANPVTGMVCRPELDGLLDQLRAEEGGNTCHV